MRLPELRGIARSLSGSVQLQPRQADMGALFEHFPPQISLHGRRRRRAHRL
jgi:hypothetical protein